ncbi:MAG: bioW [Firmicutes bacterium]|nr:bioW [Bacillota bacterium]
MLCSVRMRAAQGGSHENGGKHISGAERLVSKEQLQVVTAAMISRAMSHSRGQADFINITVETVPVKNIEEIFCLPIVTSKASGITAGREAAKEELIRAGVTPAAVHAGFEALTGLRASMRGAMVVDARTGKRLDDRGERGIRVSRMDMLDEASYVGWLRQQGYGNTHIREAVILASKVLASPGAVAELCWSDDPEYVAGYVATKNAYTRFAQLKCQGSPIGGRIIFVKENTDLEQLMTYLQYRAVLIKVPEAEVKIDAVLD